MTSGRAPLPIGAGVEQRRRHLEAIRRRVVAGTYRIPADEVARAILEWRADVGRR